MMIYIYIKYKNTTENNDSNRWEIVIDLSRFTIVYVKEKFKESNSVESNTQGNSIQCNADRSLNNSFFLMKNN